MKERSKFFANEMNRLAIEKLGPKFTINQLQKGTRLQVKTWIQLLQGVLPSSEAIDDIAEALNVTPNLVKFYILQAKDIKRRVSTPIPEELRKSVELANKALEEKASTSSPEEIEKLKDDLKLALYNVMMRGT